MHIIYSIWHHVITSFLSQSLVSPVLFIENERRLKFPWKIKKWPQMTSAIVFIIIFEIWTKFGFKWEVTWPISTIFYFWPCLTSCDPIRLFSLSIQNSEQNLESIDMSHDVIRPLSSFWPLLTTLCSSLVDRRDSKQSPLNS